jgi:PAS domain S-box-containing protein
MLFAVDVERRELYLLGQLGLSPDFVLRVERLPFDAPYVAARAAATGEIQLVEDPGRLDPAMHDAHELFLRTGTTAMIATPLASAGTLVGVLTTVHARGGFTEQEIAAIRAVADVFARSLVAARAHKLARIELDSPQVAALAFSASIALTPTLQNIVDQGRALAGAGYAALGIVDPCAPEGPFDPWVYSGLREDEARSIGRHPRPVGLLGAVVREGRTIRVANLVEDERFLGVPAHHPPMRSFLGVPVFCLGRPVGNLYFANKQGASEFSDDDARAVEMFARFAGFVVEHAREHEILRRDAAQRERDEEALRESEERFRRLVENAPDVISRFNLQRRVMDYLSPAVREVLGYRPEEYYRDPGLIWRQLHPLDRPLLEAALRAPDVVPRTFALRWIHRSGRLIWTESRMVAVRDAAGNVVARETITREVTERKLAEAEIERLAERVRVQRAWLETVIASSPAALVLVEDPLGKRISGNRATEELFGGPLPDGGVAQWAQRVRPVRGAPPFGEQRPILRALRGETVRGQEVVGMSPEGREIPCLVSAAPVLDEEGRLQGAVAVYEDIRALKELERLRIEWTAIVAHDLRQPVQTIGMQASLLAKADPAHAAQLSRIQRATEQLKRMIADLLDLSRLDVRELPLSLETVDVPALAREVVARMGDESVDRPVRVESGPDVPAIRADPLRVEEVLANLLSNAVKYGSPGTAIEVSIEVEAEDLVVSVANEGSEIAPEDVPQLFERFRRAKGASESPVRGVGLGLYIARGLVEAHGGHMWVESASGRTTFRFALPLRSKAVHRPAA